MNIIAEITTVVNTSEDVVIIMKIRFWDIIEQIKDAITTKVKPIKKG